MKTIPREEMSPASSDVVMESFFMNSASSDLYPREPATIIGGPVLSDWSVHIIGIDYRPPKDQEPNWFWRKMQFLAFGFRWTRCK